MGQSDEVSLSPSPVGVSDLPQADYSKIKRLDKSKSPSFWNRNAGALIIIAVTVFAVTTIVSVMFVMSKNDSNSTDGDVSSSKETNDSIGIFNEDKNEIEDNQEELISSSIPTDGDSSSSKETNDNLGIFNEDGNNIGENQEGSISNFIPTNVADASSEDGNEFSTDPKVEDTKDTSTNTEQLIDENDKMEFQAKVGTQLNDVPSPPENLKDTCSEDIIYSSESAYNACASNCSQASCCFSTSTGFLGFTLGECFAENVIPCTQHMPCSILFDEVIESIPQAPKDLIETCDPLNSKSSTECEDTCSLASCCFSESNNSTLGFELGDCFMENFKSCSGYIPCTFTYIIDDEDTVLLPPPENLEELCSTDAESGRSQPRRGESLACQSACAPAACCSSSDPDFSCSSDVNCDAYSEACADVNIFEDFPPPPDDLEHICAFRHIAGSADKWNACESACSEAACCNIPQLDAEEESDLSAMDLITFAMNTCLLTNTVGCSYYLPCLALNRIPKPDGGSLVLPYADAEINDVCSVKNVIFGTGREECEEMCEPAACCWNTTSLENNCLVANVFACSSYLNCATLDVSIGDGDDSETIPEDEAGSQGDASDVTGSDTNEGVLIPVPGEDYFEACSFLSIAVDDGPCKAMCAEASCCYEDAGNSCYTKNEDVCDMYKKCRRVEDDVSFFN